MSFFQALHVIGFDVAELIAPSMIIMLADDDLINLFGGGAIGKVEFILGEFVNDLFKGMLFSLIESLYLSQRVFRLSYH